MFSKEELLKLEECCGEGCLMCPYEPENEKGVTKIKITPSTLSSGFYKKRKNE